MFVHPFTWSSWNHCYDYWDTLNPAFCCLSYQENKVSHIFFKPLVLWVNYLTNGLQFPVFEELPLPVLTTEQSLSFNMWLHQFLFYSCTGGLQFSAFMFLIELHRGGRINVLKVVVHHQKHSRMLLIQQVHQSKQAEWWEEWIQRRTGSPRLPFIRKGGLRKTGGKMM